MNQGNFGQKGLCSYQWDDGVVMPIKQGTEFMNFDLLISSGYGSRETVATFL